MLDTFYIINSEGNFLLERHFRTKHPRSVCDGFLHALENIKYQAVPAVLANQNLALVHILQDHGLYFVAVVSVETPPLQTIEMLQRIYENIARYVGDVTEDTLHGQFSTVYLLLDEMIEYGQAFNTELNILEGIIAPPNLASKIVNTIAGTGSGAVLSDLPPDTSGAPSGGFGAITAAIAGTGAVNMAGGGGNSSILGSSSEIWWRRPNINYAANEVYVDILECVNAIIDENGQTILGSVLGVIEVNSKLSGVPECSLALINPDVLQSNIQFHPCVRISKFEKDNVMSFVPPDGIFPLAKYFVSDKNINLPFHMTSKFVMRDDGATIAFEASPKLNIFNQQSNMYVDKFVVKIQVPDAIVSATLTTGTGTIRFNERRKEITWIVGRLPEQCSFDGTLVYDSTMPNPCEERCSATVDFHVKGWSCTGVKLDCLQLSGVSYTPYKGCRYTSTAGKIEFRLP